MTLGLISTLLLLALLDSLNPITIAATVFLLLTPRPVFRTATFLAGAGLAYFAGGALLYLGLGAVFERVLDYLSGLWLHLLLVGGGVRMVGAAVWMDRSPPREDASGKGRVKNLNPALTFLIGANVTASDLPTAFPLIAAVERMTSAGLEIPAALAALALYVAVYALPLFLLLAGYLLLRGRSAPLLRSAERIMNRWSRPVTIGALYVLGALLVLNSGGYLVLGWSLL